MLPPLRVEKWIKTDQDWHPTKNGQVKVSLLQLKDNTWRVCVWGEDDFGLERDYPTKKFVKARTLYKKIKDWTTKEEMKRLGMYPA